MEKSAASSDSVIDYKENEFDEEDDKDLFGEQQD